jgi:hypothetical protein
MEAAWGLDDWMKHLMRRTRARPILKETVQDLESFYRRSTVETIDILVVGALEHAFAEKRLRRLFDEWQHDSLLGEAYQAAQAYQQS